MNGAELRMRRLFDADSGRADVERSLSTEPDALLIYGRNTWQAEDPLRVGRAVRSLGHEKG